MDTVPVPASTAEIIPQWVQLVMGHEVSEEDFHIEGDIQAGIGFLSSTCRVSYKTKDHGNSNKIIVKLLPTSPEFLDFVLADSSNEREILFYSKVFPDLIQVVPEIQESICGVYSTGIQKEDLDAGKPRASLLVMEDLKQSGFQMMDFAGDTTGTAVPALIKFMARLHFGGLALEVKKGVSLKELYPFLNGATENPEAISKLKELSDAGYVILEQVLLSQGTPPEIWDSYQKIVQYTGKIIQRIEEEGSRHPCLIHGDLWPSNIMVHDSLSAKALDWQLVGYKDATYELALFLITVLSKENLTKENMRKYIRQYYDEFEHLCESKGYGDKIKRRTWEEFEEFYFTWGCAFGYMICLQFIECFAKDYDKYSNVFRMCSEQLKVTDFIAKACNS